MSNLDDSRIEMIVSTLELLSSMNELILCVLPDLGNKTEEIVPLLMNVLLKLSNKDSQDSEDNQKLIKYFLSENETSFMDPLDFLLYILKLVNNRESLIVEDLPTFDEEGICVVPEEALQDVNEKLGNITKANYLRRLFGLAASTSYKQICRNPDCIRPLFVNVICELDFFFTHMVKDGVSLNDDLLLRFKEKKMKASCVSCRKSNDEYRTRCAANFVNVPEYLLIRVKYEDEEENLIDGCDLKSGDINSLIINERSYELTGVISKIAVDNYTSLRKIDGIFIDRKDNEIDVSEDYVFEKAFIMTYSLIN